MHIFARLIAIAVIAAAAHAAPARAAGMDDGRFVTVAGEGTVTATPDMAEVIAGVQTRAPGARAALDQNNAAMNKVVDALKAAGIADADVQTTRLSLSPYFDRPEQRADRRPSGYQAANRVMVRVRDLSTIGALLDTLVTAGANDVNGVRFLIAQPDALMDEARKRAVADATRRAKLLAEAAGVGLGPVQRIEETGIQAPRPMMVAADVAMQRSAPVAPGEQEIRALLNVRFGLD